MEKSKAKSAEHGPTGCRDRILDAAERVVLRQGAARLTLDAVAREAKASKGGLIYHFPSKDALILALIERVHIFWLEALRKAGEAEEKGVGHTARTLFHDAFQAINQEEVMAQCQRHQQLVACLAAAVAHQPEMIKNIRSTYSSLLKSFEKDKLPLGRSLLMLSVYDAIWWSGVFKTYELTDKQRQALEQELHTLLYLPAVKSIKRKRL